MNLRFLRGAAMIIAAAILQAGCKRHQAPPPAPSPTPTPAGIYIPEKRMERAKLFSGINVVATIETENGLTAQTEKDDPSSYTLNLLLKVRVPAPSTQLNDLKKLNERLPATLPWLEESLTKAAKVSPFYDDFYRLKVSMLNHDLPRLDQLISRQHFFDCETVLELESLTTKRHALLIQAAMDVDTDGSDSDRVASVDSNSSTFQPMTSYKWAKKTDKENPFLAASEERLRKLTQELSARGTSAERKEELAEAVKDARSDVFLLKKSSFLIAAADPYIVLPHMLMSSEPESYAPKVGDYCVVIFDRTLYPAIVGDVGPNYKIGEASLRICKEISTFSSANNGPVGELRVTYLVFPGSADKPWDVPDLDKWHARCDELLTEMGGYKGELKAWENLTKPKPTPTPTPPPPSPSASPAPSVSVSPAMSPQASPGASASPAAANPSPSMPPSQTPSPSAPPATSASPSPEASPPAKIGG